MKTKLNITLAALAAFTGSAFAGTTVTTTVAAPEADFYRAGEFQGSVSFLGAARSGGSRNGGLALGGTGVNGQPGQTGGTPLGGGRTPSWTSSTVGGVDVELRYFITRNFGMGLEGQWFNANRSIYGSALNFYLRAPLHEGSRWAPYLFAGGGGIYGPNNSSWEVHAGGGIEYRITEKVGVFTDARYEWVDRARDIAPQFGAMRVGLNFVF
jgi:hypothetical protein